MIFKQVDARRLRMKKILVIGGSRFVGRVFSIFASRNGGFELHVVNRGNHPMNLENVIQYKCDRHEPQTIARIIPDVTYDALVDFCAYDPGEISTLVDAVGDRIDQYIFISTASVYAPGNDYLDENTPLQSIPAHDMSPAASYVRNKATLENELVAACGKAGVRYTILRPTFVYGPFNYAPREPYFIELIARKRAVPVPVDASARFNFVYVIDIANALMACIGDSRADDKAFNLAERESITYDKLMSIFEQCNGEPFRTLKVTVAQVLDENIPLPFPLTENVLISGESFASTFAFNYTPFREGMEKTFTVFHSLYETP